MCGPHTTCVFVQAFVYGFVVLELQIPPVCGPHTTCECVCVCVCGSRIAPGGVVCVGHHCEYECELLVKVFVFGCRRIAQSNRV